MNEVYYVLASIENVESLFPELYDAMSPSALAYISTFKLEEDRRARRSVRMLAKLLLSFLTPHTPPFRKAQDFDILKQKSGAVFSPQSPLHLSFSHTQSHVGVAVSGKSCGIDLESSNRKVDRELIAQRFFSEEEYVRVKNTPESFYKIWTAKEAFLKREKTGIDRALKAVQISEKNLFVFCDHARTPLFTSSKKIDMENIIFSVVEGHDCREIALAELKT